MASGSVNKLLATNVNTFITFIRHYFLHGSFLAVDYWLYVKTNDWEWESDRSIALCASDHTLSSPSCLPPSQLYSVQSHGSINMLTACVCAFYPDVNTWLILCLRHVNISWWGFMWISLDKKSRFSILRYFWYVCLHFVRQTLHLYFQASECGFCRLQALFIRCRELASVN